MLEHFISLSKYLFVRIQMILISSSNFKDSLFKIVILFTGSDDEGPSNGVVSHNSSSSDDPKRKEKDASSLSASASASSSPPNSTNVTCYRFGSVGQVKY